MNSGFTRCAIFIGLLFSSLPAAQATHIMGVDITYECLGGCTYRVHWRAYRDCSGIVPIDPDFDWDEITGNAACSPPVPLNAWSAQATQEVTPLCPGMVTQCTDPSAVINGVQEYYRYRDFNLCNSPCIYRLVWNDCCRNNGITSGSAGNEVTTWLTTINTAIPCNSSPQFSNPPIPYICAGMPFTFNQGATDADGDSLAYSLGPCYDTDSLTQVGYTGGLGFAPTTPLGLSWLVNIDPITGDLSLIPSPGNLEVGVICVYVNEYRNGQLIGTVVRDMQVTVINCGPNVPPTTAGVTNVSGGMGSGFTVSTCLGSSLCFDIPVVDPNAGQTVTYWWNQNIPGATFIQTGGGMSDTIVGANPSATFCWTPPSTGTFTFLISMHDDHCPLIGSNQFTLTIVVNPPFSITATEAASCTGVVLNSSTSGGTAAFTYNWAGDAGLNGTAASLNWTYPAAGSYQYSVTATDANGCVAAFSDSVFFPGVMNLALIPVDATCATLADGSAGAALSGGTAPFTYLWNTVPAQTTSTATNLPAGTYSLLVTDANGCTANASATVNEPPPLALSLNAQNALCASSTDGSASVAVSGGTAPYAYAWNTTPVQSTATAITLTAGLYSVTVTDANQCTATGSIAVNEPAGLSALATASSTSCAGTTDGTVNVQVTGGTGVYQYLWSTGGTNAAEAGLAPGNYFVTVTDANGCTVQSSVAVEEPLPLVLSVIGNQPVCSGSADGTASVIVSGGTAPYGYQWNTAPPQTNSTATGLAQGTWQVTVTDLNGCTAVGNVTITDPPVMTAAITGSPQTCAGEPVVLMASAVNASAPLQFTWGSLPAGFTSANGQVTVAPTLATDYFVTVTDARGCTATAQHSISILAAPHALFTFSPPQGCDSLLVSFTDLSTDAVQWQWDFGDGNSASTQNAAHSFGNGTWDVTLVVWNAAGCADTFSIPALVTVIPSPVASFTSDPPAGVAVPEGQATFTFTNTSVGGSSWSWTFGDGGTASTEHAIHTYNDPGEYEVVLWVYNDFGCADSASLKPLRVIPDGVIYVPNAFSPNGDGTNEFFELKGEGIVRYQLQIYNRWGERIFESYSLSHSWDGTLRGEDAQEGVYVWKLAVSFNSGVDNQLGGTVTLIR